MPEQPIHPRHSSTLKTNIARNPTEPQPPSWMDGACESGFNVHRGDDLNALESARKLGCTRAIFSTSRGCGKADGADSGRDAQAFRARQEELRLGPLVIHPTT